MMWYAKRWKGAIFMHASPGLVVLWIVLVLLPAAAGWRRRWWPFAVYALGCVIFIVEANRGNDGWDDLADVATLVVIVLPLYVIASVVWLIQIVVGKYRKKHT